MSIIRADNRIEFSGPYRDMDIHAPLVCIHHAVEAGYQDVVLDMSGCTHAFSGPMLALCTEVMWRRYSHVDFELILPKDPTLARLFQNVNWAHYLEPRRFEKTNFRGGVARVPATQFSTPSQQSDAVNRIINAILGGIPDLRRSDFAALEWAVNELTDNVIVHSQSPIGGLVQLSSFSRKSQSVEVTISDAGLGIPKTLRSGGFEGSDTDALDKAIREGVTRDSAIGQGNGLFGSYQICSRSGGSIHIESGHAKLLKRPDPHGLDVRNQSVPVNGTLIIAKINISNPDLLQEALKFGGRAHRPVDYIETKYEQHGSNIIKFALADESSSFGSRAAGAPVQTKLLNLIQMCPDQPIEVDLEGVPLVSSSFADEVFGKLFVILGALQFMQRLRFKNVESTVQALIDKAISQRVSVNAGRGE